MGRKIGCPRCQHAKSWSIRRGKSRCAACHYEWVPRALPLRLSPGEWRRLLRWFVLGQSAEVIAQEARLERKRVLRALIVVRQAMAGTFPMSSPAWWRSTRPTWEVPGATGAWQSVFRARSGAVEPLSNYLKMARPTVAGTTGAHMRAVTHRGSSLPSCRTGPGPHGTWRAASVRSTTHRRAGYRLSPEASSFSSPMRRMCSL